ncbi:MAG: hypothetical protein IJJ99_03285 [Oscillospiraceae bacterium]|nr:hypothetical protein [Oscillospiraceae bacterium]
MRNYTNAKKMFAVLLMAAILMAGLTFGAAANSNVKEPAEPTESVQLPFEIGERVVLYNPANNVVTSYSSYSKSGAVNIRTGNASRSGSTLRSDAFETEIFYLSENSDGTYRFFSQLMHDHGTTIYMAAASPDTFQGGDDLTSTSFEIIEATGGYLLKSVSDNSYLAVEDGLVVAKELVEDDPNFLFWFAVWEGEHEETDPYNIDYICTLVGNGIDTPTE